MTVSRVAVDGPLTSTCEACIWSGRGWENAPAQSAFTVEGQFVLPIRSGRTDADIVFANTRFGLCADCEEAWSDILPPAD